MVSAFLHRGLRVRRARTIRYADGYDGPGDFAADNEWKAWNEALDWTTRCEPDDSPLYTSLVASEGEGQMPPMASGDSLSDAKNALVRDWIAGGANR